MKMLRTAYGRWSNKAQRRRRGSAPGQRARRDAFGPVAVVMVTLAANAPTARWRTEPLCKTRSLMSNETRDEEGHNRPSSIIVVEWLL